MRVDILANEKASYLQPMAEGLVRMLRGVGAEARLHSDGLSHLMRALSIDFSTPRSFAGSTTKLANNRREFSSFVDRLRGAQVIVVVAAPPGAFSPSLFPNIEVLRKLLPDTPIVNYDLHYLPMLYSWAKLILATRRPGSHPSILHSSRRESSASSVTTGISWFQLEVTRSCLPGIIHTRSSE